MSICAPIADPPLLMLHGVVITHLRCMQFSSPLELSVLREQVEAVVNKAFWGCY